MSKARAKLFAVVVAWGMSLMAAGCAREYTNPSSLAPPDEPAARETPAATSEPPRQPVPCEPPTAVAEAASRAPAESEPPAELVRLAQGIQMEPLPTPTGTPVKAGDGPLLSGSPSPRGLANGPLLLHVDNMDVRKVFELISRQGNVNILVSPNVAGCVTLDLKDMTVEEGLQAVARVCHLMVRREKDILYVYTTAEADQGDDPPVRVYHLNYVRGSDVQKMVKPMASEVLPIVNCPTGGIIHQTASSAETVVANAPAQKSTSIATRSTTG